MPQSASSFRKSNAATAVLCGLLSGQLAAQSMDFKEAMDNGGLPSTCPGPAIGPVVAGAPDRSAAPLLIRAMELDAGKTRAGEARGNVELFRADQHARTELVQFDPVAQNVTFPVRLEYTDQQVWVNAESAAYSFIDESGHFTLIDYGLTGSSANGSAESIELHGGSTSVLTGPDYTTCPGEKPDWQLHASEMKLLHEEGYGIAKGAKLRFKGMPIMYVPWFSFPIDDRRKSGFLYPTIGQASDSGIEIGIPWYWNIRPNHDATFHPRYFSKRGFMLSGDYRFLTKRTNGTLTYDYMPEDTITGEDRWHYLLRHNSQPWERWKTSLIIDRVSDDNYFQDFGTSLLQTSRQFLRSSGSLTGVGRYWNFEFMADDFQIVDDSITSTNEPYRRIPRIAYWMDRPIGSSGLFFALDSEVVHFDRDAGTVGTRLDLIPSLYWDRYMNWGFIRPSIGYRYTTYDLDRRGMVGDESPNRGTAIASLDAGLFFERTTSGGSLQTLQPRLFYLYVPYEEQTGIPTFDTGEFTFGFSQLFSTNRFAGADRQADANQVSLAVSMNHYDSDSGQALWTFNVGQIFYFDSQRVQLPGVAESDYNYSPFLGEFIWHFSSRLSGLTGLQWNWDENEVDVGTLGVRYRGEYGQRAEFEYRYRRDNVDQFDFRLFWPINERWKVISRINYSFADDEMLEIQGGLEYESCCWALRTVLRRYLRNREGDYRNGFHIELNLKGLASLGTGQRDLFRN